MAGVKSFFVTKGEQGIRNFKVTNASVICRTCKEIGLLLQSCASWTLGWACANSGQFYLKILLDLLCFLIVSVFLHDCEWNSSITTDPNNANTPCTSTTIVAQITGFASCALRQVKYQSIQVLALCSYVEFSLHLYTIIYLFPEGAFYWLLTPLAQPEFIEIGMLIWLVVL